ncbi:HAD family phosphatase [Staphylococcus felis]|uniref:HAD family hydrolase n=1 Tax=Staphylococcus felis TaxID=46127 RepID=A0AAX1RUJ1_9STAP|nr:HAD family hydrolase [Staphylococcus felis]MBH9579955.1 HAD family hydrolase [Staphylococcus felis]MDM8328118.1 HAD family hydrolase [Staphylococcus felis]MDQ7192634.1 HAD family hydrolase [Staphylococcus felis]REH74686.1 HAD family phosphatase [Staphylococcus felis]REH82553.1 HAD family phosphatase [Staphylococcus felis]
MKPDLIIMDMDDTLMTSNNEMSKVTKEYLLSIQRAGYRIALASGRPTEGMIQTAKNLEMDVNQSYIMSYNGAQTIDLSNNTVVSSQMIDKSAFDEIIDFCRDNQLFALTYHDGHIVYEGSHEYMNIESELTGLPMKKVDDLKTYIQGPVPKAMGVDYETHISELMTHMSEGFNEKIDATTSKPYFLEFMCKGVSKGAAIQDLAERLNLDTRNMIAFGDSRNDIEMFKQVGTAVAMDNASDSVKEYATMVTKSHDEDGIPYALKQLLD